MSQVCRNTNTSENEQLEMFDGIKLTGDFFENICSFFGCDLTKPAWPDEFGKLLSKRLFNEVKIRTLSLFSGAGGLDIGFHDAGFDILESVEIDKRFCDTLEKNIGEDKYFGSGSVKCIDIRQYQPRNLSRIDFVIGGPPCQTFSAAGRRANGVLGTTDSRGTLFREYVRLLRELQPRGFLFENVYGITGAQRGRPLQEILREFSGVGYRIFFRILDAADYGVPQHRERLFIIGLKHGVFLFPRPTHGPDSLDNATYYSAKQAVASAFVEESEKTVGINGKYGYLLNDIPPGLNYSFYTEKMGHPNPVFAWRSKFSDFLYKADPDAPVRTIKAQGGQYTGPFHWENRRFSINEYKRLQTFPDSYSVSGNRQTQIHQVGNSVPPQLARVLAMAIRQQVFGTEYEFRIPYLGEDEKLGFRRRKRLQTIVYSNKASKAIERKENTVSIHTLKSRSYYASLSESFDFSKKTSSNTDFLINVKWEKELHISVHDAQKGSCEEKIPTFSIRVKPNSHNWVLPVDRIVADCYSQKHLGYTAAWKAIEEELIFNNIKADLVQLCGYYQYTPRISCELVCNSDKSFNFLEEIVNDSYTHRILSNRELERLWDVSPDSVLLYAQKMRALGYEVRNHKTNPQIEEGSWLIPYAFPTLSPASVQLRKKLR